MIKRHESVRDRNDHPLPIVRLDMAAGKHFAATSAAAGNIEDTWGSGAHMISASAPVYLSIGVGASAGAQDGSIYLAAGMHYHTIIRLGETISALAVDADAAVFVVPVA